MGAHSPDDAVGHFSETAEHFDSLYQVGSYNDRVAVWQGLLDRYATPNGLSMDMGCGSGVFSFYLAEKGGRVIGIDGAPDMIALCEQQSQRRGLANVSFTVGRLPFIDRSEFGTADLVISSSVVEYVDDIDATLAMFSKALRLDGVLILSLPNKTSLSRIHQRIKYRLTGGPPVYRYIRHFSTPRDLRKKVAPFGFTLQEAHYYTAFSRIARTARALHLPKALSDDLFVAVLRKSSEGRRDGR